MSEIKTKIKSVNMNGVVLKPGHYGNWMIGGKDVFRSESQLLEYAKLGLVTVEYEKEHEPESKVQQIEITKTDHLMFRWCGNLTAANKAPMFSAFRGYKFRDGSVEMTLWRWARNGETGEYGAVHAIAVLMEVKDDLVSKKAKEVNAHLDLAVESRPKEYDIHFRYPISGKEEGDRVVSELRKMRTDIFMVEVVEAPDSFTSNISGRIKGKKP